MPMPKLTWAAQPSRRESPPHSFLAALLLFSAMTLAGATPARALVPLPLPLPLPLPQPLPLPLPDPIDQLLNLVLGPVQLKPPAPSQPQVFPPNMPTQSASVQLPVTGANVDAKLLILSADGTEPVLAAIKQAAEHAGMPYTLYIANQSPGGFTMDKLASSETHALYQGIVLTTGTLAWFNGTAWTSAFNLTEWQTLWDYQAKYGVRTAIAYALPTADLGFGPPTGFDSSTSPVSGRLSPSGAGVFQYINAANPINITWAWVYLAQPAAGTNVLMTDPAGNALALVKTYPDGREVMSLTFDNNFFLVHSLALSHGVLNWVTGGLFLGERHVYVQPQIDDIFIDNDVYATNSVYRITGADWTATAAWQSAKRLQAQTADLYLHMAFNGEGTTGTYSFDTLTPTANATDSQFPWINHTYTHRNLDADSSNYNQTYQEITRNNQVAASMGFANYDSRALVTPDVSGLTNPAAMSAAYDAGVRFLVTDTSKPGYNNPTPQAGIYNPLQPAILMIPRRPVNLYYNVTTPTQWTNEYNYLYRTYWGRDLSYSEILDKEADVLLQYMLRGEVDPWMFHQGNLRAYDGVRTLLGDLLDRTLEKYSRICNLPVRSPNMVALGQWTKQRMAYNAAGIRATIAPAQRTLTLTATRAAVVPVTGLCTVGAEVYGGQCISRVSLAAGQTVVLPIQGDSNAWTSGRLDAGPVASSGRGDMIQALSPNPFHESTTITLSLPSSGRSQLVIYDVRGRVVRTLVNGELGAGVHPIAWDGKANDGKPVAGGVYFAKLDRDGQSSVRRLVLVK